MASYISRPSLLGIPLIEAQVQWPGLQDDNHIVTSYTYRDQNCVAHAVGDLENWWWPGTKRYHYWPSGVERTETLSAFEAALGTKGYVSCGGPELEPGYEKVAIYAINEVPTHVALQLADGNWTSKLGELVDIVHSSLDDVAGPLFGLPERFMKRPHIRQETDPE